MSKKPFIHTWTDVIPMNTCTDWYNLIWNETPWKFKGQTSYTLEPFRHWCYSVPTDIFDRDESNPLTKLEDTIVRVWSSIRTFVDDAVCDLMPNKVLINAYNFGDSSWIHTDSDDEAYTCIIYLNPFWDINWGGETIFVNDFKDHIYEAVYPKAGRFVLFDGRIWHGARPLSREAPVPRLGVTFQCRKMV